MMRFTPPAAFGARPVTYVWSGTPRHLPRRLIEVALTALAVLGVCSLVTVALGLAFGVRPLVLSSGSMAPAMPVGTLAFTRPVDAAQVRDGDVVSVVRDDVRVTHRVVDARPAGGRSELTLQGDANAVPDPDPVLAARVDRVIASVPRLGELARQLGEPRTQFVVGALTGAALLWSFGPTTRHGGRWVPDTGSRRRGAFRIGASS